MTKVLERKDPDLPTSPDGGWGWVVLFASFMILNVTSGVNNSIRFLLWDLRDFQLDKDATERILSLLITLTLCSGPISSAFVNKFGCRLVTIVGAVLASASLIASAYATSVYMLYLTIGVGAGLGFGLIYLPAIVTVTSYFKKYRSLATGIVMSGSSLVSFFFPPWAESLITKLGWRGAVMIMGVLVMKCVVYGILFRPLEISPSKASEEFHKSEENNSMNTVEMETWPEKMPEEKRDSPKDIFDFYLLIDPIFILFSLSNVCIFIAFHYIYRFIYGMADEQGLNMLQIKYVFIIIRVANIVGCIVLGYLSDKSWVNRFWVYNCCLTVCGISTVLTAFCKNFFTFFIYASTFGFTMGARLGLTSVILVDLLGLSKFANAFGLLLLFKGIASFLGPLLFGWLDIAISNSLGIYAVGSTIAVSGLILFLIPTHQRHIK